MEKEGKRQWMQSFDGKIRVGPMYQAMIPPFCRADAAVKKGDGAAPAPDDASSSLGYGTDGAATPLDKAGAPGKLDKRHSARDKAHSQYLAAEDFLITH